MADLDDFFAKKDRKKSKSKPKFLTAEELVKSLEDTSKREAALKQKKPELPANPVVTEESGEVADPVVAPPVQPQTEEEWKEFEEEQRKDYTGLKIGQLQVSDEDDQSPQEENDDDNDSDGNSNLDSMGQPVEGFGPWKKVVPAEEVTQIPMDPVGKKVYVTPAMRNNPGVMSSVRRNRAAPDITNADYFPTLGAARPEEQRKKKNEPAFEEVRHGGRMQRVQPATTAPVAVANRFQTLDEDDS